MALAALCEVDPETAKEYSGVILTPVSERDRGAWVRNSRG